MAAPLPFSGPMFFGGELIFTVIAVVFCFLIYFKTKEVYNLTKYEGIKYFRYAFLFFGLSYLLRFVFGLLMLSGALFDFLPMRELFGILFILPLGYFSTISILYLIFSSVWKRFNNRNMLIFGHGLAILLSIISFITRSQAILMYLQFTLLVVAVILGFVMHKKGKKISQMNILYLLVAVLWLINLLVLDQRRPIPFGVNIFFQVVSLAVFIVIYYKILKWVK